MLLNLFLREDLANALVSGLWGQGYAFVNGRQ